MKTKRLIIAFTTVLVTLCFASAQNTQYVDIEPPLDGPNMMLNLSDPDHVANEMIEAWTSREDLPYERLEGLVRMVGMELLDTIHEVIIDPEEGAPDLQLTIFGGHNCKMIRSEVPNDESDSEAGETMEMIDFCSKDGKPFSVIIMNVLGYDDESYNFGNNMDSSLRVAYSEVGKRNKVLESLREITGFQHIEEEDIYAGYDGDDIDYGIVITTTDDEDTGLYWVEICTFL